jgi:antitoxin component YwqK of YwqJK toxin-antitoxin module
METEIKKTYHDNGSLRTEHSYIGNIRHGKHKWYFDNSQISAKHIYINGVLFRREWWNYSGTRMRIWQIKKNLENGLLIRFIYES